MLRTIAAFLVPAAGVYGYNRLRPTSWLPKSRQAVANKMRTKGFGVIDGTEVTKGPDAAAGTLEQNPLLRYLRYGTTNVGFADSTKTLGKPGVVYDPGAVSSRGKGGRTNVGFSPKSRALPDNNKQLEYDTFLKYAPKSVGKVIPKNELAGIIKKLKGTPEQKLQTLQTVLEKHPTLLRKGYVIKPVGGSQGYSSLITNETPMTDIYKRYAKQEGKKVRGLGGATLKQWRKMEHSDNERYVTAPDDVRRYDALRNLLRNPASAVVQEKLKLQKPNWLTQKVHDFKGESAPSPEYRLHVAEGKVMPASLSRHDVFDPNEIGYTTSATRAAERFAQKVLNRLPAKLRNRSFSLDVAPLQGGGHRIIESNPGGHSGLLFGTPKGGYEPNLAFRAHKIRSFLEGRDTHLLAAGKGLLGGAAGLGAATVASTLSSAGQPSEQELA